MLLIPSAVCSQSVSLPSEIQAMRGEWIVIAPDKIDGGAPRWRLDPSLTEVRLDLLFPPEVVKTLKGKVVRASKDGRFKVECWNAKGDLASDIAVCWIQVGDVNPSPDPTPDPKPGPVVSQKLWVVVIEETADASESRAAFFKSAALGERMVAKGHRLRVMDKDLVDASGTQPTWAKAYIGRSAGKTLPYVILTDMSGKLVAEQSFVMPSPESIIAFLTKWGG